MMTAENLSFRYRPHSPLLEGVSLELPTGEMVALTGPSGCGKSTLMFILGLLQKAHGGSIKYLGEELRGENDRRLSAIRLRDFGFVFQDTRLEARRSVLANVASGRIDRPFGRGHVREAELLDELDRLGIKHLAEQRAVKLSGGQAQRVGLARALAKRPRILFADEPTGNLDTANRDIIIQRMRDACRAGASVLLVTHDEQVAALCDRVARLDAT